jgi:hypothetical protein
VLEDSGSLRAPAFRVERPRAFSSVERFAP